MRLIDADRFRSAMWYTFGEQDDYFNKGMAKWDSGLWVRYKAVEEVLDSQPTIEAEPTKHGHWIDTGSGQECSVCGEIQYGYDSYRNYCACCGAKMDEVKEDGR